MICEIQQGKKIKWLFLYPRFASCAWQGPIDLRQEVVFIEKKKKELFFFFCLFFPTINARNLIAHESSVKDITHGSVMFTWEVIKL